MPVDATLKTLEKAFKNFGLRMTHQRLEIYRELACAKDHPSAEAIFRRVQSRVPTISLDTVYRTLATFEDSGLIARVQVSDDHGRFDGDRSPHHHFICIRCKSIVDFGWESFDGAELPESAETWGRVTDKNVVVRGICNSCLNQGRRPKS
ncbi:MAG: transcriptional repressor [Deltaproteobacteria bacterium]|nr:transcriptional repressor [Deltaproteobacteria bacterium]